MGLAYASIFWHFSLYVAPLGVLALCSWLALRLNRDFTAGAQAAGAQSVTPVVSLITRLTAPLWLLALLALTSLRGFEQVVAHTQLVCTGVGLRWLLLTLLSGLGGLSVFVMLAPRWASLWAPEWVLSAQFLAVVWGLSGASASLFVLLLFLEVAALLCVICLVYSFLAKPASSGLWSNFRTVNSRTQAQLGFLRSLLFFLWINAVAALLLFWGLGCTYALRGTLDTALQALLGSEASASSLSLSSLAFTLGFATKLALPALQLVVVALYRRLPLLGLASYLAFYYVFALLLGFSALAANSWVFFGVGLALWGLFGALALVGVFGLAGSIADMRGVLAVSTAVNLGFLALSLGALVW